MNGIEILNTVTQTSEKSGGLFILYIFFAIILTACAGLCIYSIKEALDGCRYLDVTDWIGVVILFLIFAGCCVCDYFLIRAAVGESKQQETIVYATIDDTVPWSEVNERYELIRQDGKIYQLRVREEN